MSYRTDDAGIIIDSLDRISEQLADLHRLLDERLPAPEVRPMTGSIQRMEDEIIVTVPDGWFS